MSTEQAFWLKHSNYNPDTSVKSHTPVRIEAPSELPKVSLINESLKKLKYQLASFDKVVKKRTTSDAITAETNENPTNPQQVPPTPQASYTLSTIKLPILKKGVSTEDANQKFLSTNEVNIAYDVSTSSGHNSQKEGSSSYTDDLMYSSFANQSRTKLHFNAKEPIGFDKSKVRTMLEWLLIPAIWAHTLSQMSAKDKSRLGYGSQIHDGVLSYENEVFASVFDSRYSDVEDSPVNDRFAKVKGMYTVPLPMTGNYMPPKSNFKIDESNLHMEYKSDSNDEHVTIPSREPKKPSFAFVNTVEHVKNPSFSHLIRDCDFHEKRMANQVELNKQKDTECLVLSPDFKLPDENQVLLRVPRQHNIYSLNLKNIVPSGGFDCLIAKATVDESTKWHRRLGHAEAISTACYVLNRALVTKPQNKTPYKLLTGKFEEKSDEGFLVGYSLSNKAFRVYNLETKRVEENLHLNYLENKPNVTGKGPTWLFDLDYLTNSMNYQPISTKNKSNKTTGPKAANNNAVETLRKTFAQSTKDLLLQARAARASNTNYVNTASTPVNAATTPLNTNQDDSQIPSLEDIYEVSKDGIFTSASYHDEGVVADFTNLKTTVNVSHILTSRIHSIYPTTQILGDPTSAVQTRSKLNKNFGAHAFVSYIKKQRRNNHNDFQHCLFAGFSSQSEPKKISQALEDESWADAIQEEGHRQEEGIDYDEVFAPVAMIKAIRIFLAFASYMGFIVYQMDVKSTFLYGKINKKVYVFQPPGFIDPKFPNKVYKVIKALYGLHQAPRAWYATLSTFLVQSGYRRGLTDKTLFIKKDKKDIMLDKYVVEILKKFDFLNVKTISTPIETKKPLVKDEEADAMDVHLYRSMIGSLMYLNASRPDIIYLKGQPKLGLWYPRESAFELEAYSDSDYAGANLDRKSTTKGCQFLGRRLISWQSNKQTIVTTLTTEAELSIAGTSSTEQPPLKDKSMWSDQEKKIQKIDRLARSFLIQGLPNDIYSLIHSNTTAKDLWDALARHMLGSEYGEQDRKATVLYECETFKATEGELFFDTYIRYLQVINDLKKCGYSKDNFELNFKFLNNLQPKWKQYAIMMRQNKNLMDINIDALYNILKQNQGDVNDAIGLKKKTVMVTFDPLALIAKKTKYANKKQKFVKSNDKKVKKKDDEKKRAMSKVKCYNCKKEGHFAKDCKKVKVKDYEYYKIKMLLAKKDKDEQVLLDEDQAWMESSSDSNQEINANMVFMAQIEKVLLDSEASSLSTDDKISEVAYYLSESESEPEYETSEYYDNTTTYGLFVNDNDDQEIFYDFENFHENLIESQIDHNELAVDHNDSEGVNKLI
nr:hypothetical protein [Tanacetum cinerariifolium]